MGKKIGMLLMTALLCAIPFTAMGKPLPWPFPYAKDCAVDWPHMDGRYRLADSDDNEIVVFDVSAGRKADTHTVHLERYLGGELIGEGSVTINDDQRSVRVTLLAPDSGVVVATALIRMHFADNQMSCARLVPILTLESKNGSPASSGKYRMVRRR